MAGTVHSDDDSRHIGLLQPLGLSGPSVTDARPAEPACSGPSGLTAGDLRPLAKVHADASRRLAVADPDGREMMISCGAALFTVRLALSSLDGACPHLVLRFGLVTQAAVSVRRDPGDVLFPGSH